MRLSKQRLSLPRPRGWGMLVPPVGVAAGLLLVASANTAQGTDLRSSRTVQISELIAAQQRDVDRLSRDTLRLRAEISAATALAGVSDSRVRDARAAADRLAPAAGLTAVTGPGVSVVLDDAPRADQVRALAAGASPDDLVIHEQDVQGVVNALWAGGAEALTIMGQRVVATTAVRCVGNTLLLQGRVYSPPFTIAAVGDPRALQAALDASPDVQVFRQYVAAFGLRLQVREERVVRAPAYAGSLTVAHATALP